MWAPALPLGAGVPRGDTVHGVRGAAAGGDARAQQRGPAGQHGDLRDGRRLQAGRLAGHVPAAGAPLLTPPPLPSPPPLDPPLVGDVSTLMESPPLLYRPASVRRLTDTK